MFALETCSLNLLTVDIFVYQEVPRTPDHAPSRTFYLFTVNLHQVARMLLDRCYQALNNLILKRLAEITENKLVSAIVPHFFKGRGSGFYPLTIFCLNNTKALHTFHPPYHTHFTLSTPHTTHTFASRRLLDKYELYERQAAEEVGGSEEEEMEELLTPDEKKRAESVRQNINK